MLSKLESRKECMEQIELIQHWNYFCSLAERLDDTKHYIDHMGYSSMFTMTIMRRHPHMDTRHGKPT